MTLKSPLVLAFGAAVVAVAVWAQTAGVSQAPDGSAPPRILSPAWLHTPGWNDHPQCQASQMGFYPPAARRKHIEGRASVDCLVQLTGELSDCHVIEETPTGFGFGDASLCMATVYQMRSVDVGGAPTAGRRVTVPMVFRLPH